MSELNYRCDYRCKIVSKLPGFSRHFTSPFIRSVKLTTNVTMAVITGAHPFRFSRDEAGQHHLVCQINHFNVTQDDYETDLVQTHAANFLQHFIHTQSHFQFQGDRTKFSRWD